jgi:hypothetical protein
MPSLPPRDGVAAPPCAGIRAGASTVSPDDRPNNVVGTSLPFPTTGEHNAFGRLSDALGTSGPTVPLGWVDGTLAHLLWGVNTIIFPLLRRVFCEHGGGLFSDGSMLYAVVGGDSIQYDGLLAHARTRSPSPRVRSSRTGMLTRVPESGRSAGRRTLALHSLRASL